MPQLWIIAGPNGAGKTTLVSRRVARRIPVVNPDVIADELPRINGALDERRAGVLALTERKRLLAESADFALETTFSGHGPASVSAACQGIGVQGHAGLCGARQRRPFRIARSGPGAARRS